jgi:hypothetical protein
MFARVFGLRAASVLEDDGVWGWQAMFDRFTRWFRTEPIADLEALEAFLDSRAAFMAQKCVFEYCRARSGALSMKLFKEQAFLEALHHSRWTSYSLVYCDVAETVEGVLRPHAGGSIRQLAVALVHMGERTFASHGLPEGAPEDFWTGALERLDTAWRRPSCTPRAPSATSPRPRSRPSSPPCRSTRPSAATTSNCCRITCASTWCASTRISSPAPTPPASAPG